MEGIIFSIEEFSIYDGPGIRTSVFLKGCPLRCSWCHNPEGQQTSPEIIKSPNGCIACGKCREYALISGDNIIYTQNSIENCPNNLLRISGEKMTPEQLYSNIMKNARMLQNGGVTFSGGEPFLQNEFLVECLSLFKGKLHTAVQTCGYCSVDNFKEVLLLADYFLFDLKLMDDTKHIKYTGVSNRMIKENFKLLAQSGKEFVTRIPLIPGVTDTNENIKLIADFLRKYNVSYVEIMPYNKMAGGKYSMLGRNYIPGFDENIEPNPQKEIFNKYEIDIKIL